MAAYRMYSDRGADCGQVWTGRVPKPGTCECAVFLGGILDASDGIPDLPVLAVAQVAGAADPQEARINDFLQRVSRSRGDGGAHRISGKEVFVRM